MKQPTFFIPHGGGPCFFMDPDDPDRVHSDPMWHPMQEYLAGLVAGLPERPTAILLVSGHWEAPVFTVHDGARPPLLFDYYGFPAHTYALRWAAPGAPDVAHRAEVLLAGAGFEMGRENARGWDHGVFIPMKVAVPEADIPLAQLSLRGDLDPAAHVAAGRALAPLRDEGVLIVGSGMSVHNLRVRGEQAVVPATAWDEALTAAVTDADPQRRAERIIGWDRLPHAGFAHPREEHLLPLMVALGAGGDDPATLDHRSRMMGWTVSGYRFG
ncbi:aromatic ring-opening dioxygenase catalytic subunit (LigB family) [Sphingobium sp. OAS761]|uniref:DODA-type extradiol aromatic ring-opening family dioxygenase n=1 Tax=Sphingobium sp. OAS761 TaxID=2817901 RepID=UPI0020A10FC6|nr:class III extradiol ring-cleavage dioxygenase [Sphingobium sp. OAS761]MCP1468942.1 aromatic ring-opening dioxygenase catalytic subunit (LigB family) [Sphingobium sp. OAS761]